MPDPVVIIEITPDGGGPLANIPPDDIPVRAVLDTDYMLVMDANGMLARVPWSSLSLPTEPTYEAVVTESGEAIVTESGEPISL